MRVKWNSIRLKTQTSFMLFEILSRQTDHQLKVLPANIGEFVFQKSANPENVLFSLAIFLLPKSLGSKSGQRIPEMSGMRNRVRQNCQVQKKQLSMETSK